MAVRTYLNAEASDGSLPLMSKRFPTHGAENRIAAVLICEKEGFDDLLSAERIPERYDLALMSTKGISARAARDLARGIGVPCFTLHDFDKNGFVMAAGFKDIATDIGIRIADIEEWSLEPELQFHQNPAKARWNLLDNGATDEEARFIADGQRVELNMLTGRDFIAFVEAKLDDHGVEKVIPDNATLEKAWTRAHLAHRVNTLIDLVQSDEASGSNDDAGRSVLTSRRGFRRCRLTSRSASSRSSTPTTPSPGMRCSGTSSVPTSRWTMAPDLQHSARNLPPHARIAAQRILDSAGRRLLAEQLNPDAISTTSGATITRSTTERISPRRPAACAPGARSRPGSRARLVRRNERKQL
jgi:hypothetical protein